MRAYRSSRVLTFAAAALLPLAALVVGAPSASAAQIVAGCDTTTLAANDDGSSDNVTLPFALQFGSRTFTSLWVNNNGNLTFDDSQSAYTPYGLEGTQREIIAPFFADADTRAIGTVSYGEITYQGHQAFCATWSDVGYFNQHTDRTNTFQAILVNRNDISTGAFDIVFNYGQIQWETGDASQGTSGLGGTSAAAGFSNGDTEYFQLPGSLVPGSFLDGGAFSLTAGSNIGTPGQWRWAMRSGTAPSEYVAMGDSFSSGEGTEVYFDDTSNPSNRCHRSPLAYPELVVASGIGQQLKFIACSGATMNEIANPETDPDRGNEPAQWNALSSKTRLVTISISGNDLQFANIMTQCVELTAGAGVGGPLTWLEASCQNLLGGKVNSLINSLATGALHAQLATVYSQLRQRAPRARIVVVTYPQFYRPVSWTNNLLACAGVRGTDQTWLNESIARADRLIADLARSYGFSVADQSDVFSAHGRGLCSSDPAMNGIVFSDSDDNKKPGRGSYHPNIAGQRLMADRVIATINSLGPITSFTRATKAQLRRATVSSPLDTTTTETLSIAQGQQVQRTIAVSGTQVAVSTAWQDGAFGLSLTSPSGVVNSLTAPAGADALNGPSFARLAVSNPEPGNWTVTVSGDQVFDPTAPVSLTTTVSHAEVAAPTAVVTWTADANGTIHLSAAGSSDPAHGVLTYHWDFGDGRTTPGATASHLYTAAGTYVPTLVVTSGTSGLSGFGTATVVVTRTTGATGGVQVIPVHAGTGVPVAAKPTVVPAVRAAFAAAGRGTISWAPPVRGYPTTFTYTYRVSANGTSVYGPARSTKARSVTLSGFKPGGVYRVQVTAANASGRGPTATYTVRVPVLAKPSVPRAVRVTYPATGAIRATWVKPAAGGFPGPVRYTVVVLTAAGKRVGVVHSTTGTTFTVRGLKVGSSYRVVVTAVNGAGASRPVSLTVRPRRV